MSSDPAASLTNRLRYSRQQHDGNQSANDDLFPPAETARPFIDFDGRGFFIHGRRTFLMSGAVHYARVPRENWRDILLKLKRAGFNCVETYVFWNFHEAVEGQYALEGGRKDIGAFIDLAHQLGLFAIIRVGPYSCAEWQNGGLPQWLAEKAALEVRRDNGPFLDAVSKWFARLLPVVADRQIHRGGNVILVQLENEQPTDGWCHWGIDFDGNYFRRLLELAQLHCIGVPTFFSGFHHGHDPAPVQPISSAKRKSPWLTMELWTTWFDRYGNAGDELIRAERKAWMVPARGGNGLNVYMWHGGTTFGFNQFNNNQAFGDARERGGTCYDFGTAIGQTGQPRELYHRLKRLAMQAETYSDILADSDDSSGEYIDFGDDVLITARTGPAGTLVFLNNEGGRRRVSLQAGQTIDMAAGEILALPQNVDLGDGLRLLESTTRVLGLLREPALTTLLCFGETGDTGTLTFNQTLEVPESAPDGWSQIDRRLTVQFFATSASHVLLHFNSRRLRVIVLDKQQADQAWIVEMSPGKRQILLGAPYLGEVATKSQQIVEADVHYPMNGHCPTEIRVIDYETAGVLPVRMKPVGVQQLELTWRAVTAAGFFSGRGASTETRATGPLELSAGGNCTPYVWYRTRVRLLESAYAMAFLRLADRAAIFVDGELKTRYDMELHPGNAVPLAIARGEHELTVFVAHGGRRKFDGFVGPIGTLESQKGLRGPVTLVTASGPVLLDEWETSGIPQDINWNSKPVTAGEPAYFRATFWLAENPPPDITYRLDSAGLSFGHVLLNGINVGRYPEIVSGCPGLWLPSCWMHAGENDLVLFDEQGLSPQGVRIPIETSASSLHAIAGIS